MKRTGKGHDFKISKTDWLTGKKEIKYPDIFFNEAHSEVGAFVYSEKIKLPRSNELKHSTKNMEKYVTLYKEVFGEQI